MEDYQTLLISREETIKSALKRIDELGEKTLFVTEQDRRIAGSVTDGDIRRWILRGENLSDPVEKVMNRNPVYLPQGSTIENLKEVMLSKRIEHIPLVDEEKRITSIIRWTELFDMQLKKKKAIDIPVVIMAGGEGKRLSPFTKILPKPLIPIGEKPIIELIIDRLYEFGCKEYYFLLNYKANMIKSYFNDLAHPYTIHFVEEGAPRGTLGGVCLLKDRISTTFFLSNCDILIDAEFDKILEFHRSNSNKITIVASVKHFTIPYGICEIKNGGCLTRITEKPEYELLVNTGFYVMEPETLRDIPEGCRYDATDLIKSYVKGHEKVGTYPISEKSWIDTGQLEELEETLRLFDSKEK
jgi:dTDP-glucose pyrophosphorylase/predicted transcriptional regulator